jgi:hypothetical protein
MLTDVPIGAWTSASFLARRRGRRDLGVRLATCCDVRVRDGAAEVRERR